ncbi:MAG: hypothetical protein HC828_01580 [Blastochloris sp.]|nr:hypothetical protein [Blastochloris sp.]
MADALQQPIRDYRDPVTGQTFVIPASVAPAPHWEWIAEVGPSEQRTHPTEPETTFQTSVTATVERLMRLTGLPEERISAFLAMPLESQLAGIAILAHLAGDAGVRDIAIQIQHFRAEQEKQQTAHMLLHSLLTAPATLGGLFLGSDDLPLEPMQTATEAVDALRDLLDREHEAYTDDYRRSFDHTEEAANARKRLRALHVAIKVIELIGA